MAENSLEECYAPEEAWAVLQERKRMYYDECAAMYTGAQSQLIRTGIPGSFWRRPGKARVHVPIAADIAATSANLLFGEEPRYTLQAGEGKSPQPDKLRRLQEMVASSGLNSRLCEAAESAAALGDVCLKLNWRENEPAPSLRVVQADDALPEYRMGHLHCLHFFTLLSENSRRGTVTRVYEQYQPGEIRMRVYLGTKSELGEPLDDSILESLGYAPHITPPIDDLLAVHIPNMRPNRLLGGEMGRSDLEGLRGLMDALDEAYSSWMRDIRLAKSRLIVPAEYLHRRGQDLFREGQYTYEFDEDVETLVALDIDTSVAGTSILPSQFAIRTEEHRVTCEHLIKTIVSMAGYSPQSFGIDIHGQAESGTALHLRERKSYNTRGKKENYWKVPLERILTAMIRLDSVSGSGIFDEDDRVSVIFSDSIANDLSTTASAVQLMRSAGVMSVEEGISTVHPDWTQDMVQAEAARIQGGEERKADVSVPAFTASKEKEHGTSAAEA